MKRKLSAIFESSVEITEYPEDKNVDDLAIDNEFPEDVLASEEAWAGGANIHKSIDHSAAAGGEPVTRGQEILNVKENFLRKVIYRTILETLDEDVLGEPDLSSEDERENDDEKQDEVSSLAGGGISGHMAAGLQYDPENPRYRKKRK